MTASASTIEKCRTYWLAPPSRDFKAYRDASRHLADFCGAGRRPPLQCMSDRPGCCKGRIIVTLIRNLPKHLTQSEVTVLWYAAFGQPLAAHLAIDAAFLEHLLTTPMIIKLLHNTGLRISDITLLGELDLSSASLSFPVSIKNSHLGDITLTDARTRSISFEGSTCGKIDAPGITIKGCLNLKAIHANGLVDLTGAHISGDLDCSAGHFTASPDAKDSKNKDLALNITSANVHGSILFSDLSPARPAASVPAATNPDPVDTTKEGHQCFTADGQILAKDMTVGGDFDCTNAKLSNPHGDRHAISLDRSRIRGSVFLRNGFEAIGEVRLIGTRISNDLDCSGGAFLNNELCPPAQQNNEDGRLNNNEDGGALKPDGKRVTIEARASHVTHSAFLGASLDGSHNDGTPRSPFTTDGLISFDFARIGGHLRIGKHEDNKKTIADSNAGTCTLLRSNRINIRNAEIHGSLSLMAAFDGIVDLTDTTVGGFIVPDALSWPHYTRRRFTYDHIHFHDVNTLEGCYDNYSTYLNWLNNLETPRNCPFDPHIHEQLATVLSRSGQEIAAKTILIDKEDRRRENMAKALRREAITNGDSSVGRRLSLWASVIWSAILQRSMKYGYKPHYLVWWSSLIVLVGWLFFLVGNQTRLIVPTEKFVSEYGGADVLKTPHCSRTARQWQTEGRNTYYPTFDPFIYSLEVFVPVVKFGQQAYWQPDDVGCSPHSEIEAAPPNAWKWEWRPITFGGIFGDVLRWWSWFEATAGWLCVTLVAVALTGLIPKSSSKA